MPKHKLTLSNKKKIITKAKNQKINLRSFLEIQLSDYLKAKNCTRWGGNSNLLVNEVFHNKNISGKGFEHQLTSKNYDHT